MITKKIFYTLFACVLIAGTVSAQTAKQKRADKYYESFSYVKAASLYEDLAKQNMANDQSLKRLADSYNHTGNYLKAEEWYSKLYKENKADAEETYSYAQVLKANGKDNEAELVLQKFHAIKGSDSRAVEYIKKKTEIAKLKSEKPYFLVAGIQGNSVEADFSPTFWNDKVLFVSGRNHSLANVTTHTWNDKPFLNLYVADRDANRNLTEIKKFEGHVNTKYHEGPSVFTKDGKTLYFTRNNYFKHKYNKSTKGVNMLELYRAVNKDGTWTTDKLSVDNDEYSVGHPALSADEKTLYFVSDMPGGMGGTDLWKAPINADGSIGTPLNLGAPVNTEGNEMFPYMSPDGVLYFSSNGHLGFGELDVFAAQPSKTGTFAKVMNLGAQVNSGKDDFGFVLDKDGRFGYLSSNRDGGAGDDDIYAVTAMRPLKVSYMVKGVVYEKGTTTPLINANIEFKDAKGTVIQTVSTNESGAYEFEVEPQLNYSLAGTKEKYFGGENKFNTNELGDKTELTKDIYLEKDPGLSLFALITDAKSAAPLEGVKVSMEDEFTDETVNFTTPATGDFRKPLSGKKIGDEIVYLIKLEKAGYLTKTVAFSKKVDKAGEIKVHEALDMTMSKLEIGGDLAKMIDIKPIYFDLGKYAIRKDAAAELDKIVKIMNEYPTMVVQLGSHTDCRSSMASNMKLSDNRAKSSAQYIKSRIANPERISGKGFGETKLLNGCACEGTVKSTCSEADHQANRRTEFIIVKM
jgi:outer membrane protein OmpA-like peptidoglycan-associated protein/tetratricopeptide (TPR) repeat protein